MDTHLDTHSLQGLDVATLARLWLIAHQGRHWPPAQMRVGLRLNSQLWIARAARAARTGVSPVARIATVRSGAGLLV